MSTVVNGQITQLSVSQVERFDHNQTGGCERAWWFERAKDLRPDETRGQAEGTAGHALLASYLSTGAEPAGKVLMGKAVRGVIVKGELPKPGPDLLVEERFDGQPKLGPDGRWLPLDVANTLTVAGVPFEGFIDLAFNRTGTPEVWDHKFSSDPRQYAKRTEDLIKTVQLPLYVLAMRQAYWPDAQRWRIAHHNVSKKGVDSFIRADVVHVDQVLERVADVESVIARMKVIAAAPEQNEVPFNRRACSAWSGCAHQSVCRAFKEKAVQLTAEEAALFADLDSVPSMEPAPAVAPAPAAAPVVAPPAAPAPAAEPPAKPKRRGKITDLSTPEGSAAPAPVHTEAPAAPAPCACGEAITPENGSRLSSGEWRHIGCKLNAPAPKPAAPSPEPKPVVKSMDAPGVDFPKVIPAPLPATATPAAPLTVVIPPKAFTPPTAPASPSLAEFVAEDVSRTAGEAQRARIAAVARLLESAAALLRAEL